MSRSEILETLVGMLSVTVLAVLLGVSYASDQIGGKTGFGSAYSLAAAFNRVDGLAVGDSVMLGGIRIGTVEGLALLPDYRARVRIKIEEDIRLPVDTSASIQTDGLFGSKFVALDPGGAEQSLTDGSEITFTQDAVIVSELLELIIAEGKAMRRQSAKADQ